MTDAAPRARTGAMTGPMTDDADRTYPPAPPLTRADMPTDLSISLDRYTGGRAHRIPATPEAMGPAQDMPGFDGYRNVIDYIVRITHRIWETDEREVGYIEACYAPGSLVFDEYGLQTGSAKIIADTHHTTGAFPDIVLDAEEVIWAGDARRGFHTSHRARLMGVNSGPSRHGEPTGRRIDVMCLANCVALRNDIYLEHVCYNTVKMLADLGLDPWDEAARMVADPPAGWPRSGEVWNALRSAAAPPVPLSEAEPVEGFDPDAFARRVHASLWCGDRAALATDYAGDVTFEGAGGRRFTGVGAYGDHLGEMRGAFPDLSLQVDEVYWMGSEAEGWRIATRWSAEGTHTGGGVTYGEPTGAACQVWGITQSNVEDGRVVAEWQLFNEFDLMMQIVRARS